MIYARIRAIIMLCILIRSTPLPSYIGGDFFKSLASIRVEPDVTVDVSSMQPGDIIYILGYGAYMDFFVQQVHPFITVPYILITHDSDCPSPGAYASLLDDPHLVAWFGQNQNATHPKFTGLPNGIPNKDKGPHGNQKVFDRALADIKAHPEKYHTKLICSNFSPTKFRTAINQWLMHQNFVDDIPWTTLYKYLTTMAEYKFVLSPIGAGIDTYRTWEALLVGTIPVIEHSPMDPVLEGLPVVLIDDWNQITPEFLHEQYQKITAQTDWRWEKLEKIYWAKKILAVQEKIRKEAQACSPSY